jgi:purine-binding chemotaxis protein CheW
MKRKNVGEIKEEDILQFVAFKVQDKKFAIEIGHVREIIRFQKATALPTVPDFIEGVIDLRGEIVPIFDLRKRFSAPVKYDLFTRILIVKGNGKVLGLIADEASEVITVSVKEIKAAPQITKFYKAAFIIGMIAHKKSIHIILDVEKVLTEEEKLSLEKIRVS